MKKLFILLLFFYLPAYADEGGGKTTFSHHLKKGQKAIPKRSNMRSSVIRGAVSRAMRGRR